MAPFNPFDNLGGVLGGLAKGFSGLMPQDDPEVRLMTLQGEISDLQNQENSIYAQIGKLALERGSGQFPELENKLRLVQENLADTQVKLKAAQQEKDAKEQSKRAEEEKSTCPNCGTRNPEGVKFCQDCGSKLGVSNKLFCTNCGAEQPAGTRFCGECGNKLS
ncbi:MAG: zinc ribbon domain-containing protein [Bacillota bacterium]